MDYANEVYLRKQVKHVQASWDFYPDGLTWITKEEEWSISNSEKVLHVDNVWQLLRKVSMDRFEEPVDETKSNQLISSSLMARDNLLRMDLN